MASQAAELIIGRMVKNTAKLRKPTASASRRPPRPKIVVVCSPQREQMGAVHPPFRFQVRGWRRPR